MFDRLTLAGALTRRGWLDPQRLAGMDWGDISIAVKKAVEWFQKWHELPQSGEVDDATAARLFARPFCGHPDRLDMVAEAQTPKRLDPLNLTWRWAGPSLPTHADDQVRVAIQQAFDAWAAHAPLKAAEAAPGSAPDCVIVSGRIDGRFGTLAWMELPTLPNRQQNGKLDSQEAWDQTQGVPLLPVLTHELGHFLGMGHIPGNGTALMNPAISSITKPVGPDIQAVQALYGSGPVPIPPGPQPPPAGIVTLDLGLKVVTCPPGWSLKIQ